MCKYEQTTIDKTFFEDGTELVERHDDETEKYYFEGRQLVTAFEIEEGFRLDALSDLIEQATQYR